MTSASKGWQRWVVFILLFVHISTHSGLAIAQANSPNSGQTRGSGVDTEPPLIEHEVQPLLQPGPVQVFEAIVVDDKQLESVLLFYRFAGESIYNRLQMKRISASSSWRVEVPVAAQASDDLEYYIEASDRSGNRTFRGFTFNPLLRRVPDQSLVQTDPGTSGQAAETRPPQASGSNSKRVLYYVLGALAVGVIAGVASSAGGSGDDGGGGDAEDCCQLTLTVEEPFE